MFVCAAPFPYLALGRYNGRHRKGRRTPFGRDTRRTRGEDTPAGRLATGLTCRADTDVRAAGCSERCPQPENSDHGDRAVECDGRRTHRRQGTSAGCYWRAAGSCPATPLPGKPASCVRKQARGRSPAGKLPPHRKHAERTDASVKQKDRAGPTKAKAHTHTRANIGRAWCAKRAGWGPRLLSVKVAGAEAGSRMPPWYV